MTAKLLSIIAALSIIVAAILLSPSAGRAFGVTPGHTPMHFNCPPGSHGKPRYDGVGHRLHAARALKDRALTAP